MCLNIQNMMSDCVKGIYLLRFLLNLCRIMATGPQDRSLRARGARARLGCLMQLSASLQLQQLWWDCRVCLHRKFLLILLNHNVL